MSIEDSESRRFELTFVWVFLRPILAQDLPRIFFSRFFSKFETFFRRFVLIASDTEIFRGYLWNSIFSATSRFQCHRSFLQLSICAEFEDELIIVNREVQGGRQIRIGQYALQPGRIRNFPDTSQGHIRVPTKLPSLQNRPHNWRFKNVFFDFFFYLKWDMLSMMQLNTTRRCVVDIPSGRRVWASSRWMRGSPR